MEQHRLLAKCLSRYEVLTDRSFQAFQSGSKVEFGAVKGLGTLAGGHAGPGGLLSTDPDKRHVTRSPGTQNLEDTALELQKNNSSTLAGSERSLENLAQKHSPSQVQQIIDSHKAICGD